MHLSYFSGSLIPSTRANSVHVMKMCAAFAGQGVKVTLFGKKGGGDDPFSFYGVTEKFDLCLSPVRNGFLRLLFSSYHFFVRKKPDVAYGRDPWMLCVAGLVSPVVFEMHEVPRGIQKLAVYFLLKNRNTKLIVCISNGLKIDVFNEFLFCDNNKIIVAHDGADFYKNDTDFILKKSRLAIGYAGSLLPGKGGDVVVRLAATMRGYDFHIFGGDAQQIEKLRMLYGGDNIHFHGHVPHGNLPSCLAGLDVVLAPYQEKMALRTGADIARWISPLKLFEYMAAGKAIICSDLPVLREIIRDGDNGLMVVPDDLDAWKAAIERLAVDEALRARLAAAGQADLLAHYTWEKRAQILLCAIKNAVPVLQ